MEDATVDTRNILMTAVKKHADYVNLRNKSPTTFLSKEQLSRLMEKSTKIQDSFTHIPVYLVLEHISKLKNI